MKSTLVLASLILALTGCSSASVTPVKRGIGLGTYLKGAAPREFLVGEAAPSWKMRPLMTNLMRVYESEMVAISVVPYSQALVELSVKENVGDAQRDRELKERSTYFQDETCFIIEVAAHEEETARFNRWAGTAQNAGGKPQNLVIRAGTFLKDLPVHSKKYFPRYAWENSTLACTGKLNLSQPLRVGLSIPGHVDEEPGDPIIFGWN